MNTYDPQQTLAAITDNAVPIVLIGGVSIVAMWVFFVEAARMSRRDKVAPMALWMTVLWWPHDGNYLLNFDDWFSRYDHWFMQLFWFAIIVTFVSESIYVVQTISYGRDELSPGAACSSCGPPEPEGTPGLSTSQATGRSPSGLVGAHPSGPALRT